MLNLLFCYLFKRYKCLHTKINFDNTNRFCPDCGNEINISWYVAKCAHCHTKRQSYLYVDSVITLEKHCSKCGEEKFYMEEKNNPEFFELKYCVQVKEIIKKAPIINKKIQVWIDKNEESRRYKGPELLPLFGKS